MAGCPGISTVESDGLTSSTKEVLSTGHALCIEVTLALERGELRDRNGLGGRRITTHGEGNLPLRSIYDLHLGAPCCQGHQCEDHHYVPKLFHYQFLNLSKIIKIS